MRSSVTRTLVLVVVLIVSGCGWFTSAEDKAIVVLDEAIRKLETTSTTWERVVAETRDELARQGQTTLANEVSNVLSKAVTDVAIEGRCSVDFLRDRVREDLVHLRATLTGEKVTYVPVFCNPTPAAIDLNLPPERRPIVEISGYNLTLAAVRAELEDEQGRRAAVNDAVDNPSPYLVTVNVNRMPINEKSRRLVFTLTSGTGTTTVRTVAILPPAAKPEPVYVAAVVHVVGWVDLNDDENIVSDENKRSNVDQRIIVPAGAGTAHHWEDCVGDEVQGYLDVALVLDSRSGAVSGAGNSQYFEGDDCGVTDKQGEREIVFRIGPNGQYVYSVQLKDSDGGITFSLTYINESQQVQRSTAISH